MLNKDGVCLPWACVSLRVFASPRQVLGSPPSVGASSPGTGGRFLPVAPSQPLHKVQLRLNQERMGQHRGPSPDGGQGCLVGSRGDPEDLLPGTRAGGALSTAGSSVLGLNKGPPHASP